MTRSPFATAFEQINQILGICPCCGDLFRLADARPYLKGKKPHSVLDDLENEELRVERAEERLDEREAELREKAKISGLRSAKALLKKIDPIFSGKGIDPQDVKVIFDPIEYVVFDGLNSAVTTRIVLSAGPPENRHQEKVQKSVARTLKRGDIQFHTLRVSDDGQIDLS